MDRRPAVEARPPVLIETIVRVSIPPAILPLVELGMGLLIHRSSQDMVRKLDVRIDTLASAEERSR